MTNRHINSGFSIIEAMIVVTIIGILVAIAVPSFQDSIERNSLKQAVEGLKSDMQYARTEAIKKSQSVTITRIPGNAGNWCYGLTTKNNCNCTQSTITATNYCELKRVFGTNLNTVNINQIEHHESYSNKFNFRRGTIWQNSVRFSTNNYDACVVFSSVGRVSICVPSGSTRISNYPTCEGSCET